MTPLLYLHMFSNKDFAYFANVRGAVRLRDDAVGLPRRIGFDLGLYVGRARATRVGGVRVE